MCRCFSSCCPSEWVSRFFACNWHCRLCCFRFTVDDHFRNVFGFVSFQDGMLNHFLAKNCMELFPTAKKTLSWSWWWCSPNFLVHKHITFWGMDELQPFFVDLNPRKPLGPGVFSTGLEEARIHGELWRPLGTSDLVIWSQLPALSLIYWTP